MALPLWNDEGNFTLRASCCLNTPGGMSCSAYERLICVDDSSRCRRRGGASPASLAWASTACSFVFKASARWGMSFGTCLRKQVARMRFL